MIHAGPPASSSTKLNDTERSVPADVIHNKRSAVWRLICKRMAGQRKSEPKGEGFMKKALTLGLGTAIIIGMTYGALSLRAGDKIKMCHRTGNGSAHVIEISVNAMHAHLSHGDSPADPTARHGSSCVPNSGV